MSIRRPLTDQTSATVPLTAGINRAKPNSACISWAARSASFSSMMTAILISEVDTSWMLPDNWHQDFAGVLEFILVNRE